MANPSVKSAVQLINFGHFNHEVHAPAIRMLKWCRPEAPSRPGGFLKHKVHAVEGEEGETLLRAIEHHREPYHANVKRQRTIQVRHIKFRGWTAHGMFTPGLMALIARSFFVRLKLQPAP
jgi:hypothetical protein